MKKSRKLVVLAAMLVLVPLTLWAKYPVKDITNIVVFGAGGGTDTLNRVVSAEMAKALKVNISVVNVPGGAGGSVGLLEADSKASDGYTICGLSESIVTAPVMGGFSKRVTNWEYFLVGGSPEVLSVKTGSQYKSLDDFIAAAKANPGAIKVGASTAGSFHHINMLAFEKGAGIKLNFIPYGGSGPCQNALLTGELDAVFTTVAEQAPFIKGNQFMPLAMLSPSDFTIEKTKIVSAFKKYPQLKQYLPVYQAIGMAVKADASAEVKKTLNAAFTKAMKSSTVRNKLKEMYYLPLGLTGQKALDLMISHESNFSWTLWELKTAKIDPSTIGIAKP
jgi:tripartite-type tricarboxylate transporter receptor subunit TctC